MDFLTNGGKKTIWNQDKLNFNKKAQVYEIIKLFTLRIFYIFGFKYGEAVIAQFDFYS